ncbi:MAG: ribonuclease P protein component [Clostridia bacterium]|nr:ribonuclease P protein component [Clostridia bacterium]
MKYDTLKENHLFSKAYRNGQRAGGKYITVYVMPDYHAARLQRANPLKSRINRVGITAAKRLGVAVERNRVKRIMREAYYKALKTYDIKTGKIIVITARSAAVTAKTGDVYGDLVSAFEKTGILGEKKEDNVE